VAIGWALAMAALCDASWAKAVPRLNMKSMKNQTGTISLLGLILSSVIGVFGGAADMAFGKKHGLSIERKACLILRSLLLLSNTN
jgi:hypothetical protein